MKKVIIVLGLLLAACVVQDGYSFRYKELDNNEIHVTFVDYKSRPDFQRALEKYNAITKDRTTQAFSLISKKGKNCEVHMFDPTKKYRPEWLGHEIYHCRYGRFHK